MNDYLEAEQLIIARLEREMGDQFRAISDWGDYARLEEAKLPTPSAYVIYNGDTFGEGSGDGSLLRIEQQWGVVIVVRNVSRRSDRGIRETAGPLMGRVLEILLGYKLSPRFRSMRRLPAPEPEYSDRVGYFPLLFSVPMIMTGDPS